MPTIDVSEVLTDPDFLDSFTVTRTTESLTNGINTPTTQTFENVVGVVTADSHLNLQWTPEGTLVAGAITIYTQFRLTNGGGDVQADCVTWHGNSYTVENTNDWTGYGQGFIVATCTLNQVNP